MSLFRNFIIILLFSYSVNCYSGAWLQPQGSTQIILTNAANFSDPYSKFYSSIYMEHGLKKSTIGAYIYRKYKTRKVREHEKNIRYNKYEDDRFIEFFSRKKIYEKSNLIISSEKSIIIKPTGYKHKISFLYYLNHPANPQFEYEIGLMRNHNETLNLSNNIAIRTDLTKNIRFLFQVFRNYKHLRFKYISRNPGNKLLYPSYIHKIMSINSSTSLVYRLNKNLSTEFGVNFSHNQMNKKTIFFSIWIDI